MGIDSSSENLIVANLPLELEGHNNELRTVVEMVRHTGDCDVIIDFSNANIVGSPTFSRLLELRRQLCESGHKLLLCGVAPKTKAVFSVAMLDKLFDFVEDRPAALASLQGCA